VLIPGVEEQLRALDCPGKIAGGVETALRDEQLVGVHRVDLDRNARRPRAELGGRDAGMKQQGPFAPDRVWASIRAGSTPSENPA